MRPDLDGKEVKTGRPRWMPLGGRGDVFGFRVCRWGSAFFFKKNNNDDRPTTGGLLLLTLKNNTFKIVYVPNKYSQCGLQKSFAIVYGA